VSSEREGEITSDNSDTAPIDSTKGPDRPGIPGIPGIPATDKKGWTQEITGAVSMTLYGVPEKRLEANRCAPQHTTHDNRSDFAEEAPGTLDGMNVDDGIDIDIGADIGVGVDREETNVPNA